MGCAIVASDTQPLHEAIKHNETGRLIDFFDVESLIDEVCKLLDDPVTRERLGAAARKFAIKTYDRQSVTLPKQVEWVERLT